MARAKPEAQEKARRTLITTLCKINDLDPVLGGKWKRGMLRYYAARLAELMLVEAGSKEPTTPDVVDMAVRILDLVESGDLDGS